MSNSNFGQATTLGRRVGAVILAVTLVGGAWLINEKTTLLQRPTKESEVPAGLTGIGANIEAPKAVMQSAQAPANSTLSGKPYTTGCSMKVLTIAWNGTMPIHLATGGVETVEGSLFAKNGVRVKLERQDDYGKMQEEQIKFADAVSKGNNCPSDGAAFVIIMGDGYPAYVQGLAESMGKLKQGVEVFYATGYSYGEDKCMLPAGFDKNPQLARGSLIGAVMRDGDYNICVTWAAQNGIPINPDEKTYDPTAMNFRSVTAFTEADNGLIAGYKETRDEVRGGKRTGKKVEVAQNGTATWTPGDVKIAKTVGGYVAVASTREYSYQMPATIIGNRDFMKRNSVVIKSMIRALADAGQQIKTSDAAMRRAAEVETLVYKEESADYWMRYAKGVTENDKQGLPIFLGGSRVNTLADNAFLFGLGGNDNLYRRIYTQFGDHNVKYYKELIPEYPKYENVVNTSYLAEVIKDLPAAQAIAMADTPKYSQEAPMGKIIAKRNWLIEFETGKATLRPESIPVLEEMLNQISITNLQVEIRGHTDNIGNTSSNLTLSRARAETVKQFLMTNARSGFPESRVSTKGYGDTSPLGDNKTSEGRQQNRRVEVILGTTS